MTHFCTDYDPDIQAQGDCRNCGHTYETHHEAKEAKPMVSPILKHFEYQHLPESLQKVSGPFGELALKLEVTLPDGPEKSAGLRKLLEAKDCMVRASLS